MKKRTKKYRPMAALVNPIAHVVEGLTGVATHGEDFTRLNLKHQAAILALRRGVATRGNIGTLINMSNMVEALWQMGFGAEFEKVVLHGQHSLLAIARRGELLGRYVARGEELTAVCSLLELHDAQMKIITIREMDKALEMVCKLVASKKAVKVEVIKGAAS